MNETRTTNILNRVAPLLFCLVPLFTACGGSGGSGGPVGPGPGGGGDGGGPLPGGAIPAAHAGLIAAAAGSGEVRLELDLPASGYQAGVFLATDARLVYSSGTPDRIVTTTSTKYTALTNGTQRFYGLGIRQGTTGAWTPVGEVLRATPRAPIYVDAAATTAGNGTLASPYRSLAAAAAAAPIDSTIWVKDGTYAGPVVVKVGTNVFGGFPAGTAFSLDTRNAQGGATIVTAGSLQAAIDANLLSLGGNRIVLDGLVCRGNGVGLYGVDTQHADIDLRSVVINGFADRGIRMRHLGVGIAPPNENAIAQLVHCTVQQNGADGLSVVGSYNLSVDHCSFDANVQEGIELGPLYGISSAVPTTVHIRASRFANNGAEGVDASLAQPIGVTAGSATFDIQVESSTFQGNGLDGLLVDQEHELAPGWRGHIVIRDCAAHHNALAGVHIDADAPGEFLVHRVRATANGTDGVFVSSELAAGLVTVSASYLAGNLGAGLNTSLGNKRLLATHCVFAGNQAGGFLGNTIECAAANCIAHLQPTPFQNVRQLGSPISTDAASAVFSNLPSAYSRVNTHATGTLGLAAAPSFATGATVEVADDEVVRHAATVAGTTVVLDSTPTLRRVPTMVTAFESTTVTEDARLAAASPVAGAGMKELGAANVDPGPFGAPVGGAPGVTDTLPESLAWLDQITPTPPTNLGNTQAVVLRFARAVVNPADSTAPSLDTATVTSGRLRVLNAAGTALAIGIGTPVQNTVTINPPAGGWPTGALRLEVHRGITAGGTPIQPVIVPLR